jgi:hypothetical protein
MVQFFMNGGPAMFFVLVLGLAGLVAAGRFMRTPDARRVDTVKALSLATAFATVTAIATDLAAVGYNVAKFEGPLGPIVLQGFAESMSPAILGGTFLCVTWMLMAVGFRRLASRSLP